MNATLGEWIDGHDILVPPETITDGHGNTLPDSRGLFVVHAVMLHTGKVLWFCGHVEDGHYALKSYLFDYNDPNALLQPQHFPLHNPNLARGTKEELHPPASTETHADLFCCHFVHAPDGKVIVIGGSDPDYRVPPPGTTHGSVGERYMYAFDPVAERWRVLQAGSKISRLAQGRWYPTAVLLGDGRIAVFSGRREFGATSVAIQWQDTVAQIVEILSPGASGTYTDYTASTLADSTLPQPEPPLPLRLPLPIYPGLHLAPDGRIYYTHTTWGLEFDPPANTQSIEIAPGAKAARWTDLGIQPHQPRREEGMSVLLPPAHKGKILLFGGSEALTAADQRAAINGAARTFHHIADATDSRSNEVLHTTGLAAPVWNPNLPLRRGRINGHAVILPDKKVLIFGGHNSYKWRAIATPTPAMTPTMPSFETELYDPDTNTTARMDVLKHPRMYHSAAVLLPNGSVLVAGGADPNALELTVHGAGTPDNFKYPEGPDAAKWLGPRLLPNTPYNRKDYEIFEPTYFRPLSARPVIDAVRRNGAWTTHAAYGSTIMIDTNHAPTIDAVALIRPGAATHHTDTEQRYVELEPITHVSATRLTVTMPTNRNLAPPGYYMLWIVDHGKPCKEAKFILLHEPRPVRRASPPRSP